MKNDTDTSTTEERGRSHADILERENLAIRAAAVMDRNRWSKAEAARRIGMPEGTFNQWLSGKYAGRLDTTNDIVSNWLDAVEEMQAMAATFPRAPFHVRTSLYDDLTDLMMAAQMAPAMVMATCGAGMGKTHAARRYRDTHPHCWVATMTPYTRTTHGALQTVARAVGLTRIANGELVPAIAGRVARKEAPTLLVVDEAQWLSDDAINQLRHFVDEFDCGLALLGNSAVYRKFSQWSDDDRQAQLQSRAFKRLQRERSSPADIALLLDAWGIDDPKQAEFLTGIGLKGGALRGINYTVQLARMRALGGERDMTLADLKAAWKNRDVELRQ